MDLFSNIPTEDNIPPPLSDIMRTPDYLTPIAKLVSFNSPDKNQFTVYMHFKSMILGRSRSYLNKEIDVNILQSSVSKRHAIINFNENGNYEFTLQNWGKNGTRVNGILYKNTEKIPLRHGATIVPGITGSELRFHVFCDVVDKVIAEDRMKKQLQKLKEQQQQSQVFSQPQLGHLLPSFVRIALGKELLFNQNHAGTIY